MVVDGNHENFDIINSLPEQEMFGSKVGVIKNSIFHLKRGQIYNIDGQTFLAMGGAVSIDKDSRLIREARGENKQWWAEELWTKAEEDYCLDKLDEYEWNVDYVISHTVSYSIITNMFPEFSNDAIKVNDPVANFFNHLITDGGLKFKHWYFGHFHEDRGFDKYTCSYNNIHKIKEK